MTTKYLVMVWHDITKPEHVHGSWFSAARYVIRNGLRDACAIVPF